ncbi:MAG: hypothetical protein M3O82_10370 [Verrucomicrobiota bacterium]|jgi:hypothetical protein|nr:hypothetical protein [Verrucomicrobiota bacterium]
MKRDLIPILESKRTFHRRVAARPIAEKLRMLDALRERTLAIRRASNSGLAKKPVVQETPPDLPVTDH